MPVEYTNRKGDIHYLKVVETKKGATRYYIVKDKEKLKSNESVNTIPADYEFYEFPEDGRVSFRKKQKSIFNENEKHIVTKVLNKQEHIDDFIIDLEKDALMIYIAFLVKSEYEREFGIKLDLIHFNRIQSYIPRIRIIKSSNNYEIQRFCNLSQYYGWITMETASDLEKLCEKYCPHIGKESLLDFWIEEK